ncbi:MAG TPA: hypothetical protein VGG03_03575 [Thermoanaerobaculia bacterium]
MAGKKKNWLINVTAYTAAGLLASALVGWGLAALGRALLPSGMSGPAAVLCLGIASLAAAREMGWVSLPLPQHRRQTRDVWAKWFRSPVAAALWGFDVGFLFTTWFTLAGVWLLVAVAFLAREPWFGTLLFAIYWLGRALSVWVAPLLLEDAASTPRLLAAIEEHRSFVQRVHVLALAWALGVLVAILTQGARLGS